MMIIFVLKIYPQFILNIIPICVIGTYKQNYQGNNSWRKKYLTQQNNQNITKYIKYNQINTINQITNFLMIAAEYKISGKKFLISLTNE